MITGTDLIEHGWPQGKAIGLALKAATQLRDRGMDEDEILRQLEKARITPAPEVDETLVPLAREWESIRAAEAVPADELRDEAIPYEVWGSGLIEQNTTAQMEGAMRLPVSVGGALMPDAHLGYGLPVGGVLATEGAVTPWAVGVDIACRMRLSVFEVSADLLDGRRDDLADVLLRNTNFGAGSKYKEGRRPEHEVLDDPAWGATSFVKGLKDEVKPDDSHLFKQWIDFYADPAVADINHRYADLIDCLAERAGKDELLRMEDHFMTSCQVEHMFWSMAYSLEDWPV